MEPTTEVVRVANLANFDRVKSNIVIGRKRTRDEAKERKEEESEVLFVEAKRGEFAPSWVAIARRAKLRSANECRWPHSFRRAQFVEDWRRKRQLADNEPLFFGDNKKRAKPSSSLSWNTYRLVRSLRWERKEGQTADGKERRLYYIFNAYEKGAGSGQFIGVLRWGTVPDTAIDGNTIAFALGNKEAALAYISGQLSFWTDRSTMTTDWSHQGFVASRPPTTLGEGAGSGPAAAAAAAAAAAVMASAPSTTLLPLNAILASGGQSLADANPSGSPTAGIMAPPTTTQQSNLVSSVLQQLNPARTAAGIAAAAGTVAPDLSSIMQLSRSGELGTGGPLNVSGAFRPSFGGATAGTVQPLLRARGAQGNPLQGQGNPLQQALLQGAPGAALSNPATLQALLAKSKGNPPF